MLGFLLYKVYTRFFYKSDSMPWYRTFIYIGLNTIFHSFFIYMMIDGVLKNMQIELNFSRIVYVLIFGLLPIVYVYFRFFYKKDINYYEDKYKNHWLNKFYFDGILILMPFLVFISAPILRIILFGGEMFNHPYIGALVFLFKN